MRVCACESGVKVVADIFLVDDVLVGFFVLVALAVAEVDHKDEGRLRLEAN